ncbi:hypothetical protein AX16_004196 [Volvariella volvacea WC 439]|nr:hypothetical protein AX16_004196 [Volvariella volvacea WC 439]
MSYTRIASPPLPSNSSLPSRESIPMSNLIPRQLYPPSRPKAPITPARRKRLLISYAPDWIITIVLAAIFLSLEKVEGYRRSFSVEDTSLRHTFAVHERVPNAALIVICLVVPLILQPIINFLTVRSLWDLHNSALGLILGLSVSGVITQFVKITVGRPRPDLVDRCRPPPGTRDPEFGLSEWTICTNTDAYILRDGFRSFPSGHASLSFAGLGFLAFYIAGKLHLFDRRGVAGKAWLALGPFAAAALVAISRTMDYRHHWQDVLVGSLLGTVCSYFSYRQYYPSLADELCHRPYSPRIAREDALPTSTYDSADYPEGTAPRPTDIDLEAAWQKRGASHSSTNVNNEPPARDGGALR